MPNWNDPVTIGGREIVLTPHVGALALFKSTGNWMVLSGPESPTWDEQVRKHHTPILPAVPDGCTREQVLGLIAVYHTNDALAASYPTGDFHLTENHECNMHRLFTHSRMFDRAELPELKLAIQRYEALMAWWDANAPEVQNDTH